MSGNVLSSTLVFVLLFQTSYVTDFSVHPRRVVLRAPARRQCWRGESDPLEAALHRSPLRVCQQSRYHCDARKEEGDTVSTVYSLTGVTDTY